MAFFGLFGKSEEEKIREAKAKEWIKLKMCNFLQEDATCILKSNLSLASAEYEPCDFEFCIIQTLLQKVK
jgi:hypothetical protein